MGRSYGVGRSYLIGLQNCAMHTVQVPRACPRLYSVTLCVCAAAPTLAMPTVKTGCHEFVMFNVLCFSVAHTKSGDADRLWATTVEVVASRLTVSVLMKRPSGIATARSYRIGDQNCAMHTVHVPAIWPLL